LTSQQICCSCGSNLVKIELEDSDEWICKNCNVINFKKYIGNSEFK